VWLRSFLTSTLEEHAWSTSRSGRFIPGKRLRWSRGSVIDFGTQDHGFAPCRSRRIFRAKKSSSRLPSACKRSLNIRYRSEFRQNSRKFSRPQFHLPLLVSLVWCHAWRRLVAKVGTSKPDRTISLKRLQCVIEKINLGESTPVHI
jgi:hypothetical protein